MEDPKHAQPARDPSTPTEWQEAVDAARILLLIDSARQYGLVTGGPLADVERCQSILAEGARRGIRPRPDRLLIEKFFEPSIN